MDNKLTYIVNVQTSGDAAKKGLMDGTCFTGLFLSSLLIFRFCIFEFGVQMRARTQMWIEREVANKSCFLSLLLLLIS